MVKSIARRLSFTCLVAGVVLSLGASGTEQCFPQAAIPVPATSEGVYVNLATGASGATEGGVPGFDIDIYASVNSNPSGQMKFYWGSPATGGAGVASVGDVYAVLAPGQTVDSTSIFTRMAFTGDTSAWQAGVIGYLGLRFKNESTDTIVYGWMRLATSAPLGFPATILGWCYEDTGGAIAIPGGPPDALFADGFDP